MAPELEEKPTASSVVPWVFTGLLDSQNLFNLADLLLDLAGRLLVGAFVFQIWIIDSLSRLLLDLALHFGNLPSAWSLVLGFMASSSLSFEPLCPVPRILWASGN